MFLTTFFICQACSKNQCHGEHRPHPNVTDSPHFSVVDLRKYGGDSFWRNLLRALLASRTFACCLGRWKELYRRKGHRPWPLATIFLLLPKEANSKTDQLGMGASGREGSRERKGGSLGNFFKFCNEIFVSLFVFVFVRGKEKEGEKSSDSRVKDTGFHCRAR
jgi:hypothetical protein